MMFLEDTERFLSGLGTLRFMGDDIESYGLRKGTALADRNNVTVLDWEGGRAVRGNILVPLFKTTVLSDVMQVIPSDDDSSLHLRRHDLSDEDPASDRNIPGEGTFLVDVTSLDGGVGCFNTETNILHKTHRLLTG